MIDLLVLLGPPGSGKSFLGELLGRRLGLDWTEHEAQLLGRWGTKERFLANKAAALAELESGLRERLGRGRTVIFESTGLSDRPMLERIARDHRVAIVQLTVPRELCARRVAARAKGRHLEDGAGGTATFHDYWTREVAPTWSADLEVVNDATAGDADGARRTEAIVAQVAQVLAGR